MSWRKNGHGLHRDLVIMYIYWMSANNTFSALFLLFDEISASNIPPILHLMPSIRLQHSHSGNISIHCLSQSSYRSKTLLSRRLVFLTDTLQTFASLEGNTGIWSLGKYHCNVIELSSHYPRRCSAVSRAVYQKTSSSRLIWRRSGARIPCRSNRWRMLIIPQILHQRQRSDPHDQRPFPRIPFLHLQE